ncbi:MAG: helix-turn-helix domain-containing protein [Eubacteriales bacterium]
MFDTEKFGRYISGLRKSADMTQSELGDRVGVTRQAISKYERGESFPDVSILSEIASAFSVTLEALIASGGPTDGEARILEGAARGEAVRAEKGEDIVSLAPLLKPSLLSRLSESFDRQGIDISNVLNLAEYLNETDSRRLAASVTFNNIADMDVVLLEKLLPVVGPYASYTIFEKVLNGELDLSYLDIVYPYTGMPVELIENAVVNGVLDESALDIIRRHNYNNEMRVILGYIPEIFTCPKCGENLKHFYPQRCKCGHKLPIENNVGDFMGTSGDKMPSDRSSAEYILQKTSGRGVLLCSAGIGAESIRPMLQSSDLNLIIASGDIGELRDIETKLHHMSSGQIIFVRMDTNEPNIAANALDAVVGFSDLPEKLLHKLLREGGVAISDGRVTYENN